MPQILTLLDDFDEILPLLSPFCTENLVFAQILTLLSHLSQIPTSLGLYEQENMLFGQTLTLLGQFYKCPHCCIDVSVSGGQQEFIENSQYHMDGPKALRAACVRA